ncbi:hypothetical protein PHLGIDRAFT_117837 [Phlebiopsis gigantea 11061_1 CR5-6]|uniref:Uncharacterized protein n=1 Tax=Phlebiopsis gigantea (strain 11061_1 CR5-6) TaxID=745531 RepID=A0A0C3S8W9_PHLG1|nr:hypothetical protein PHLGIDRAFT_117837 [Phlebiopsis gigantea 11061_1 CR5-6]
MAFFMSTDTAAQSRALYAQLLALPAPPYPDTGRVPADAALQAPTAALRTHPAHFLMRHMRCST